MCIMYAFLIFICEINMLLVLAPVTQPAAYYNAIQIQIIIKEIEPDNIWKKFPTKQKYKDYNFTGQEKLFLLLQKIHERKFHRLVYWQTKSTLALIFTEFFNI